MDPDPSSPEQTLFKQWRKAADESHFFELGLARKALSAEGEAVSEEEWREALALRDISNRLYVLFLDDIDQKIRTLRGRRPEAERSKCVWFNGREATGNRAHK